MAKSDSTARARGIDFETASHIFAGPTFDRPDTRRDYGEQRFVAVGRAAETILAVTYAMRGDNRRIISARRANRRERDAYRALFP